jgi:hypothetical protein
MFEFCVFLTIVKIETSHVVWNHLFSSVTSKNGHIGSSHWCYTGKRLILIWSTVCGSGSRGASPLLKNSSHAASFWLMVPWKCLGLVLGIRVRHNSPVDCVDRPLIRFFIRFAFISLKRVTPWCWRSAIDWSISCCTGLCRMKTRWTWG